MIPRIKRLIFGLTLVVLAFKYWVKPHSKPFTALSDTEYWGPDSAAIYMENTTIREFDISIKPKVIEDLKAQLSRPLIYHKPLEGIGFQYGFNSDYLMKVVQYWRDIYLPRWSEREAFLKQFPHYVTQIQGLSIHYIHVKPKSTEGKKVIPLLLLHGWPGSVREFYKIIPLLTKPNPKSAYVFEVIAPSLPGFGWSQGASKINFGPAQMAVVLRNLMLRLGHEKFLIQGGDWGSIIGSNIATLRPENVLGYHSNTCSTHHKISHLYKLLRVWFPILFVKAKHQDFFKPIGEEFIFILQESGYYHIQATKPDTIGTALSQNPVGLAAYILEKFSTWTNPGFRNLKDGGLTKHFTLDELLDNIMIYYLTNSITTSQRLFSEALSFAQLRLKVDVGHVYAPSGCARFLYDLRHSTDFELRTKFKNLIHSTYYKNAGHFAAMEVPEVLYNDFVEFVDKALSQTQANLKKDL